MHWRDNKRTRKSMDNSLSRQVCAFKKSKFWGLSQKTLSTLELFYTLIISRGNWGNIKNISQTRVNTDGAPGRICALWCQWQRLDIPMTNMHLRLHFLEHDWTKIHKLAYRNSTRALFRMKKLQKSDELKRAVEILNSYSLNSRGSLSLRTETSLVMTLWSYPSCFIKRQRLGSFREKLHFLITRYSSPVIWLSSGVLNIIRILFGIICKLWLEKYKLTAHMSATFLFWTVSSGRMEWILCAPATTWVNVEGNGDDVDVEDDDGLDGEQTWNQLFCRPDMQCAAQTMCILGEFV